MPFIAGIFLWTFLEYVGHRLYHWWYAAGPDPHHLHPAKLDIGPSWTFTIFLVLVFGLLMRFSGLYLGFVFMLGVYSLVHYACHHYTFYRPLIKGIRRRHRLHHKQGDVYFGVTTPLWDYIAGTYPHE